jgi:hypothetical protein
MVQAVQVWCVHHTNPSHTSCKTVPPPLTMSTCCSRKQRKYGIRQLEGTPFLSPSARQAITPSAWEPAKQCHLPSAREHVVRAHAAHVCMAGNTTVNSRKVVAVQLKSRRHCTAPWQVINCWQSHNTRPCGLQETHRSTRSGIQHQLLTWHSIRCRGAQRRLDTK